MIQVILDTALDPQFPLSRSELRELLATICTALGMEQTIETGFTLRLVDDAQMAKLNSEFLGCQGPTNVLSFPFDDDEDGLGAIALSVPTLAREADLYEQDKAEHLARLLAHAILHLSGLAHGPEMEMLTEEAVQQVGQRGF